VFALLGLRSTQHAAEATAKEVGSHWIRFFEKLMRKNDNLLSEQAERLVSSAIISAASMFVPVLDQYPLLKTVKLESWDSL
jgi:hypothetical protein